MDHNIEKEVTTDSGVNRVELTLRQDEDERGDKVDLTGLLSTLLRGRKIILMSLMIALIFSTVIVVLRYTILRQSVGTVSTVVSFDFDGLSNGLDPYGEPFDVTEIKKAEVITKAIEETGLNDKDISVEDVRRNISISGIIPKDVMEQIQIINQMAEKDPSKLEKLNDINYVATQYKVDFNIEKKTNLNKEESMQLLRNIITCYREYFIDKYSDKYLLSKAVSELDISRYDYAEAIILAEEQLNTMKDYINDKNVASPDFIAKSTGMSFGELLSNIEIINNIDLNRVQSLIYAFNLSKDPIKLTAIYENQITEMERKAGQKRGEATSTRQVIENYKKDTSLLMVGGESNAAAELTRGSSVYDTLVKQANDAENEAVRLTSESAYYRTLIARLTGEDETIDVRTKERYTVEVQEELNNLLTKLGEITEITNETIDSYYETEVYSTAVKMAIEPVYGNNLKEYIKSAVMVTAIAAIAAIVLSIMYILVKGVLKESKHTV